MKKYLLFMFLVLAGCMTALAGSDIKVVGGNKKFLKGAEGQAILVFDWEGATYDDKMPLSSKFKNLEELKQVAWKGFVKTFNDKSRKVKVISDEAGAKYRFALKVTKMDQYFKVMGFIPSNATKAWGIMTVTDLGSGEVLATIKVDGVDGGANPSPDGTFSDCFEELAKQISKLK